MYDRNYWVDHVKDESGEVIQQGTLLDQAHFNPMEEGISDAYLAEAISVFGQVQKDFEYQPEVKTVSLSMNSSYPWPFNNKETTVALSQLRENTSYHVAINVDDYSGGQIGNIHVLDRALNGFKLKHDGSATSVTVTLRIEGGMTA
ncbi:MAG: hypothetical protein LUD12_10125 [Lachnospiraceae bacterium]|nr:hypothetical protein [Lachnospiraceae bacterium]